MNDLISRQDAIDAFKKELTVGESKNNYVTICSAISYEGAKQILENLPSAQSERKKGYMKIKVISAVEGEGLFCENCNAYCLSPLYNFCPKCGIEFIGVRGEQE